MDDAYRRRHMYLFLLVLVVGTQVGFQGWRTLFNNFAVEVGGLSGFDVLIDRNAAGMHHLPERFGGERADGDLDDGGVFADHPEIAQAVFAGGRSFADQVVARRGRCEAFARLPPRDLLSVGKERVTVQNGIAFEGNPFPPVIKVAHYLVSTETFTLSKKAR